ncbi:MAG: DUF362 domain-containing protein [Candidatus Eisenbacteria bacterium]
MASQVYLLRLTDWKDFEAVAAALPPFLQETGLLDDVRAQRPSAIKLTFGEGGNRAHPPVAVVREIVAFLKRRGTRPFLTETNTLYRGRRMNVLDHLDLAWEHGFTPERVGAPILFGDGLLGRETFDVPLAGPNVKIAHLSPILRDTDFLVGLAHMTGHLLCGFGGAIKNIGMGLASRAGKLDMHSVISPVVREEKCTLCLECAKACATRAIDSGPRAVTIDPQRCTGCAECLPTCPTGALGIDWDRDTRRVQERMAEYALAVARTVGHRMAFVTLLNHISDHCDCMGETPNCIAPDIGIVASRDPVALDQASLDLIARAAGGDPFLRAWPEVAGNVQVTHAEAIGLGSRTYELIEP